MDRRAFFAFACLFCSLTMASHAQSQSSPPAPASQPPPTLRVYSRLVLVDVTVTDATGNPVHGLTRADFHIADNKRPQRISTFEEHLPDPKARPASLPRETGVHSNDFLVHPPPVFNVILIDTNTIDVVDQMYLYQQLKQFVAGLPPNQPVAIYHRWGDRTLLLQNFTADHDLLSTAIRKAIPRLRQTGWWSYTDIGTLKQLLAPFDAIPGRKNILWFTGGSNLFLFPVPTAVTPEYETELHDLYDRLEAARIALYPIDARGLTVDWNMGMLQQHSTMQEMAIATGGHAYYNNNGLTEIASRVIADDASYYTLTYSPDNVHLDHKWHKVKVNVDESSYQLSYRRGYFDDAVNAANPSKPVAPSLLRTAGGAVPSQDIPGEPIIFQVRVRPATDLPPAKVGQLPNPPLHPPKKGETTYTIHYTAPLNVFQQEVNGPERSIKPCAAWVAFDKYGGKLGSFGQVIRLTFNQNQAGTKIEFDQSVNLPRGNDTLFIALWDEATGRIGSLQVPVEVPK